MIRYRSAAHDWWRDLVPRAGYPGDRAALAKLRRASTISEAMTEEASIALFRRVGATSAEDLPRVALAAAVLARVSKEPDGPNAPRSVARVLGPQKADDVSTAILSPLRFKRLLAADEPEEQLIAFRRMVAIARGSLPVRDLADALLDWSETRRRRWVFDYWNASEIASTPTTDAPEEPV
ncbi:MULTISPECIES: type I-E CRISPR-associated protein Cse2/CasB [Acidiphilium]|uniref:CRISPR-associated protein, Cse2 family n=1 Tax=Acidiphilium cryptum (strain JF-5) TaxID=349163 RepID=A5FZI2_ACICJ|nr:MULTISPECIES: type I-E CRISPR-associated protein Cse2/CasB [Acidiphilium]ABQ31014.1 CRISPR-associated protein, Cse2 family [Acidiphilium cryptum JF-5]EGO93868.1 hypothetical protein APM_3471 [Acidiphilium sp. PM]MBS3025056.1 type I-E CRISPR-associated protein Cse2/CasB [Acidiphilium multivorum]MDA8208667.1 type I-E CRISPR-associated protein Cse2/CasB [Actinomycetota bacterium]